jgi:hypothetical protein
MIAIIGTVLFTMSLITIISKDDDDFHPDTEI